MWSEDEDVMFYPFIRGIPRHLVTVEQAKASILIENDLYEIEVEDLGTQNFGELQGEVTRIHYEDVDYGITEELHIGDFGQHHIVVRMFEDDELLFELKEVKFQD